MVAGWVPHSVLDGTSGLQRAPALRGWYGWFSSATMTPAVHRHGQLITAWAWHPDGHRISLMAAIGQQLDSAMYTIPLDGGQPTVTTLPESMRNMTGADIGEFVWAPAGDALFVERRVNYIWNIWKLDVDPHTLSAGALVRFSAGTGQDTRMMVARDGKRIAFTIKAESIRLWAYLLDPVSGSLSGTGEPVTDATAAVPGTGALGLMAAISLMQSQV